MAEKKESTKIEREYVIPLREKCRPVPRYRKTPKAVKTVKEFVARHMKVENRDLKKVKIDRYLNEILWMRGIKKTLHKVKVKAVKEEDIVRVYAVELPDKLNFKKIREEKFEKESSEEAEKIKESKKSLTEKAKDQLKSKGPKEGESEEKKEEEKEEKEKEEAVKEESQKKAKEEAKKEKKTTSTKKKGEHLEEVGQKKSSN